MRILTLICFCLISLASFAQRKPNIVVIISDDHSYQTIGAYGSKIGHTPNLDRIAKEGAVFTRGYVTNSICGPSRASLLTGKYSNKNGFKDNETSNFNHGQNSFVKELHNNGYQTAWIGKIHLGRKLEGFDYYSILTGQGHYFNPDFISSKEGDKEVVAREEGYVADLVTDKALDWLKEQDKQEPFCLIIGHKNTHRTWMPAIEDFGKNDAKEIPLPETFYDDYAGRKAAAGQEMSIDKDMQMGYDLKMFENIEKMRADGNFSRMSDEQFQAYVDYYKPIYEELKKSNLSGKALAEWKYHRYMVDYLNTAESMDRNIGRVLDYLKEHNLEDNTLVLYLSDQGFYMGEHGWFDKRFMYEESFRTPMLMKLPGMIKPSSKITGMVSNVDIGPTFLELSGTKVPADMQGRSFLSLLNGKKKDIQDQIYYHYYENGEHAVSPHFGVSDGRYKLIRFYKRVDAWELYDMKADPREMKNVYGQAKYKKVQARLEKLLKQEIDRLEDEDAKVVLSKN
ncbi:sulfatase family protein [Sphingobacterium mizutaii]|uniref:sulfatase family protein n=1 Tax=Sphingobacterium mizutaii TaxID=1010 RepID=UPI003D9930DF